MAMHTWFECRIRYERMMDNGMQKKVTEPYLYRSGSTYHRRDDPLHIGRIHRIGY